MKRKERKMIPRYFVKFDGRRPENGFVTFEKAFSIDTAPTGPTTYKLVVNHRDDLVLQAIVRRHKTDLNVNLNVQAHTEQVSEFPATTLSAKVRMKYEEVVL